ncbi:MAG: AAA family ATPase, partial [Candidatus Hecatellaceae archaeon]
MTYITGVSGAGKTSLAKGLASKFGGLHVELGKLSLEEGLTLGFDKRRKCHIADLEGLEKFLVEKFSEVRGFIAFEAPFTVRLRRPLTPKAVFVLRCEPRELAKRLKDKGYPPSKILENVWAEILDYP